MKAPRAPEEHAAVQGSLVPHGIRSGSIGKPCLLTTLAALGVGALLAGCGQKGPLYLPQAAPAVAASPAASAASTPAAVIRP